MNLFSNAKDALKELKNQKDKYIEIVIDIKSDKKNGIVKVIDNGGGISQEVLDRMFEPYFTTKHQSSGTGIGLYMSKEIIEKQMNGSIWAENISCKFNNKIYKNCACINILMPIKER